MLTALCVTGCDAIQVLNVASATYQSILSFGFQVLGYFDYGITAIFAFEVVVKVSDWQYQGI